MHRFVGLLRGVNVGRSKRVPMATLRALLADQGFRDIQTLLNSGNVVFAAPGAAGARHAARIEAAILDALNIEVPVVVKSADDFGAIVRGNALARVATDPSRLLVAFTADARCLRGLGALLALVTPPEQFVLGKHAAYLWCPQGILASRVADALLGKHAYGATSRNWATVVRIAALLRHGTA